MPKGCRRRASALTPRNKAERTQVEAALEVLRGSGVGYTFRRSKHLVMVLDNGQTITIAGTPRDIGVAADVVRRNTRNAVTP